MKKNIKDIGDICENLFLDYMKQNSKYVSIDKSINPYDMQKDVIGINEDDSRDTYEIKSRTVIRKYHAMPLEKSQWYKADTCKYLVFNNIPTNYDEPITFYLVCDKDDYQVVKSFGFSKEPVRMYDISKMKKIFTIENKDTIENICNLSISKYKQV